MSRHNLWPRAPRTAVIPVMAGVVAAGLRHAGQAPGSCSGRRCRRRPFRPARIRPLALAAGAGVNNTNRYGGTALIPATEGGHVDTARNNGGPRQQDVVRQFLDAGADPNIRDPDGRTALENAERLGFMEIAGLDPRPWLTTEPLTHADSPHFSCRRTTTRRAFGVTRRCRTGKPGKPSGVDVPGQ